MDLPSLFEDIILSSQKYVDTLNSKLITFIDDLMCSIKLDQNMTYQQQIDVSLNKLHYYMFANKLTLKLRHYKTDVCLSEPRHQSQTPSQG